MNSLEILCCPSCKKPLDPANGQDPGGLICHECGVTYSNDNGYIDFMGEKELIHSSKREKFIRSVYARIYTPATNFMFLFCGGAANARREVLTRIDVKDNDRILETGMGAGENLEWLSKKADNLSFYAIDIQKQMIHNCFRNLEKWKLRAEIFRADAHDLPFADEQFDIVFHLGAINLFSDKKRAIDEMIRVAKPGTPVVIADETDKAGRLFNILTGANDRIVPPLDLIPDNMANKKIEIIWRGYGYVISFVKS